MEEAEAAMVNEEDVGEEIDEEAEFGDEGAAIAGQAVRGNQIWTYLLPYENSKWNNGRMTTRPTRTTTKKTSRAGSGCWSSQCVNRAGTCLNKGLVRYGNTNDKRWLCDDNRNLRDARGYSVGYTHRRAKAGRVAYTVVTENGNNVWKPADPNAGCARGKITTYSLMLPYEDGKLSVNSYGVPQFSDFPKRIGCCTANQCIDSNYRCSDPGILRHRKYACDGDGDNEGSIDIDGDGDAYSYSHGTWRICNRNTRGQKILISGIEYECRIHEWWPVN